jgi:hypothetical protein
MRHPTPLPAGLPPHFARSQQPSPTSLQPPARPSSGQSVPVYPSAATQSRPMPPRRAP